MTKVGILLGSLRKASFSRKLAENVANLFPEGYETEFIEIGNLLYTIRILMTITRFRPSIRHSGIQ